MNSGKQGQGRRTSLQKMDWLAGLSILILLLILSIPGDWLAAIEAWVKSLISLPQRPPAPGWLPTDKVVHILLFLLTSVPVMLALHLRQLPLMQRKHLPVRQVAMQTLLVMVVIALLSEWIQSYVPGRSADSMDVLADVIGIMIAITLIYLVSLRSGSNKNRR